jgi:ribosomal protein L37AE/L43A
VKLVKRLGVVYIRCRKCGALYQTGVYMDKKTYDSQVRAMEIVRICPYCQTNNSSATAQLVLQGN